MPAARIVGLIRDMEKEPLGESRPRPPSTALSRAVPHLVAVVSIVAVGLLRWRHFVVLDQARFDEQVYLNAARALLAGGSPYEAVSYVYNPPFAFAVEALARGLGELGALRVLRVLDLVGAAVAIWCSLLLLRASWRVRVLCGWLLVTLSPVLGSAMLHGNVSLLFGGMAIGGLSLLKRLGVLGGVLLGVSVALKPMAVPAIAALLASRRFSLRLAGVVALVSMGCTLLIGVRWLPDLLSRAEGLPHVSANISIHRVVYCFGGTIPPILFLIACCLLAAWLSRRGDLDATGVLVLGTVLSLLSIPSATQHTYLLAYPVAALGVRALLDLPKPRGVVPWSFVLVCLLAIHSVNGVGIMSSLPLPAQGILAAIPVLAPTALCLWLRSRGAFDPEPPADD